MNFFKTKDKPFTYKKPKVKIVRYFQVLYNSKNGQTKSFKVHKITPIAICGLLILSLISTGVISTYYLSLRNTLVKLEEINHANGNLKGEVEALSHKIKNIQLTMNQVEVLSSKIKKAASRTDDRDKIANNENSDKDKNEIKLTDSLGIGPLTKEDYELSQQLTGIKRNSLELKTLFDEVDSSEAESSKKLLEFKKLMAELRKYNTKLQLIPDLAPTKGRLSSTYGWRMSPFSGKERMHLGLDIAAPLGTAIYATAEGTVVHAAVTEDYGRMLEIQHTPKLLTRYAHTSAIYVKEGQKVKKGDIIAAVGSTGRSTGPHVHYEIEVDGRRVDPTTYIVLW